MEKAFNPSKKPVFIYFYCKEWIDFCQNIWSLSKKEMILETLTGRETTPPPLWTASKNLALATKKRRILRLWLYEEAIMEALHRNDRYMFNKFCELFRKEKNKADSTQESDTDSAYKYLFVRRIFPQFYDIKL